MTASACREQAVAFECLGERLIGVVSMPAVPSRTALVVVVGGPQVRTGSHRQFSQLCRAVTAAGIVAFRFDVRGMGDSSGQLQSFEHLQADIGAAIGALQGRLPEVEQVVLFGLCDGASAALLYCQAKRDTRVAGLVLLNPWVRSPQTLARAHLKHYYWARLREPAFWRKLLGGGVTLRAARELVSNVKIARHARIQQEGNKPPPSLPFQQRMLQGAEGFAGPILLVLSEMDYTAREFTELLRQESGWQRLVGQPRVQRLDVAGADHTFSTRERQEVLDALTVRWLSSGAIGLSSQGERRCDARGTPSERTGREQQC